MHNVYFYQAQSEERERYLDDTIDENDTYSHLQEIFPDITAQRLLQATADGRDVNDAAELLLQEGISCLLSNFLCFHLLKLQEAHIADY